MTKAEKIKEFAQLHLNHAYVYGGTGQPCTPAYRSARQAQYPQFAAQIARNCPVLSGRQVTCTRCRWEGKKAFDCAQLTRRAAESAGYKLPSGARSQFYNVPWAKKDVIAHLPPGQVAFLYNKKSNGSVPHTGIACGDGTFVHARGHAEGVIWERMGAYPWTHFALLPGMEEGSPINPQEEKKEVFINIEVLPGRRLMRGEHIKKMQIALKNQGYDVGDKGADGIYGKMSRAAVEAWQKAQGTTADGVVTKSVFDAILAAAEAPAATPPSVQLFRVVLFGLSAEEKDALLLQFGDRAKTDEG